MEKLTNIIELHTEDFAVIVTDARVLMIRTRRLDLEWNLPFEDMQLVRMERGVITLVKSKQGSHPKLIPCPDPMAAKALVARIEEAFSRYLSKVKWVK
jgi:vacuolar protein sorting-associated protein 13A/C